MRQLLKWLVFAFGMALVIGFTYGLWVTAGAILCVQGATSECVR
jgi:hypothetical protein